MNGKTRTRLTAFLLVFLVLLTLLPTVSFAAKKVVKPLAAGFNPKHPAGACIEAHILGWNKKKETIRFQFVVPERFAAKDIISLKAGDFIYTQGRKVKVRSILIDDEDGPKVIYVNHRAEDPEEDNLWMFEDPDGNISHLRFEETVQTVLDPVNIPLDYNMIFLDSTAPSSNGNPAAFSAEEFLSALAADPSGFASGSFLVAFDAFGSLKFIWRQY